eukprot:scaffold45694_cov19-Tisochrysis_lutea.AAC.3
MMGTCSSNISCKSYAMASSCGWAGQQERGGGSEERIAKGGKGWIGMASKMGAGCHTRGTMHDEGGSDTGIPSVAQFCSSWRHTGFPGAQQEAMLSVRP